MLIDAPGKPEVKPLSRALRRAFNRNRRTNEHPDELADALRWINRNTRLVGELAEPSLFRSVIAALEKKQDGERAAHDTIRLRRTTFRSALDYAVEEKLLQANPP
jgi:hypothetical protein